MPTFKQKNVIKSYKLRLQEKLKTVTEETEIATSFLNNRIDEFRKRVQQILEIKDEKCLSLYRKLNSDLESFSEKLYILQASLEEVTDEESGSSEDDEESVKLPKSEQNASSSSSSQRESPSCFSEKSNSNIYENVSVQIQSERNVDKLKALENKENVFKCPEAILHYPENSSLQRHSKNVGQQIHSIENVVYPGHGEDGESVTEDDFHSINSDNNVQNTNSFALSNSELLNYQSKFVSENTYSSNVSVSQSSCYRSISSSINESLPSHQEIPCKLESKSIEFENLCSSESSNSIECVTKEVFSQFSGTLSYVIDPGNFWIQLENSHGYELNFPKSKYDHLDGLTTIRKGDYCLAPFKSSPFYYRARSLSDGKSLCDSVQVQFIDHGSIQEVLLYDLRPLPKSAYKFPAQAIHCYLHGIRPTGNSWSDKCIKKFKESQNFCIETLVKSKDNLYGVELVAKLSADFDEDFSTDIAQSLCLEGLALSNDESLPCDIKQNEICRSELSKPTSDKTESSLEVSGSYDINAISSDSGVSITSTDKSSQISNQRNEIFHKVTKDSAASVAVKNVSSYGKDPLDFHQDTQMKDLMLFDSCNAINYLQNSREVLKSSRDHLVSSICLSCRNRNFCLHLKIPSPSLLFVQEDMVIVMLSHIVSPQEFYVNMAMENSNLLDDLREQMKYTYETESNIHPIRVSDVKEGMFCAGQFEEDGYWYRLKIIRISLEDRKKIQVLGQFIDYGNCEVIKIYDLRPLTPDFAKHPNFAIKCSLAGISPVKGVRSSNNLPWSDDAISHFKKLTSFDRCLTAQICSKLCSSQIDSYPVLLWDTQDSKDLLINELLVEQKVALFDETFVQTPSAIQTNEKSQLDSWDPMAEEYNNADNNYNVDNEDIEHIANGYKSKDANYICKYFSLHGRCPRGSRCSYEHRPLLENGLTYDKEEVYCFDNVLLIPETVTNVLVQVSTILTPSHFYVVLPFGCKTVDDIDNLVLRGSSYDEIINYEARALFRELDEHYSKTTFRENTGLALSCGTIVAAKRQWDDKWHRGRIVDVIDVNKPAKVFFLDSGDNEWISRKFIRTILPQFLFTPFQAIHCCLNGIQPVASENGETWTSDAVNFFKDVVAGEILLGEIVHRSGQEYRLSLRKTLHNNHKSIAQLLVSAGFAQYQETGHCKKKTTMYVPG